MNFIFQAISSLRSQSLGRNRAFSQNNLLDDENPETELNNTFQLFVENYRKAYEELTDTGVSDGKGILYTTTTNYSNCCSL